MFVFKFIYNGLALGGEAVVVASTEKEAMKLLKKELSEWQYKSVELKNVLNFSVPMVVHNWNGDY